MQLKNLATDEIIAQGAPFGMTPRVARRIQTLIVKFRNPELPLTLEHFGRSKWDLVRAAARIPKLNLVETVVSPTDAFAKYLFTGNGPERFEAVRIPLMHRAGDEKYVICVSSQAGCAVGCAFCATGRMGFKRNLEPWEMVDQVLRIQDASAFPIRGVVFMGMGEPLLNYESVVTAARILSDPSAGSIDSKSITISTAGVVPMMRRFTEDRLPFRLITSLHAATDELRDQLVPINRNYPLAKVMAALREYQAAKRRRVILAWTMIPGVNMNREQMAALRRITEGMRIVLDLIPVNDSTGKYRAPTMDEIRTFLDLVREEVSCPIAIRYSGGKDVNGACGMLAGKTAEDS